MKLERLPLLWSGFCNSLKFTNGPFLILQRLLQRNLPVVTYVHKARWYLITDARFGDHEMVKEVLAEGEYDAYLDRVITGGSCSYVNVGANIGAFDIAVASRCAISRALAVELNPQTFIRLQLNLQLNRLETVQSLHAGIADGCGTIQFAPSGCAYSDSIIGGASTRMDQARAVPVPLLTLEQAMTTSFPGADGWDLLKLDCEGAEYAIIRHVSPALLRKFRAIIMEIHQPPAGCSIEELARKLLECGFTTAPGSSQVKGENELSFWTRE
jgi:FkbM family methyltransferase